MPQPADTDPLRNARRALRQLVAAVYVRVEARHLGRRPNADERAALEHYWADAIDQDMRQLEAPLRQAFAVGLGLIQRAAHAAEGLDHEMVDQAVGAAWTAMMERDGEK